MTGLETILQQIADDAKAETEELLQTAKAEQEKLLTEAKAKAKETEQAAIALGEEQAKQIRERAESAAQMQRRNAVLACKQELISETIEQTKHALATAPDEQYFSVLVKLAGKFAAEGKAELRLNQKDLNRLPADFAEQLKVAAPQAEITVSDKPIDIKDGFLLVYGGIDINCTLDAVFDGAQAELSDAVSRILWQVTA